MTHSRLRDLREDNDLRQKDIAKALNLHPHTYGNYELGIRNVPYDVLIGAALHYNTSVDYILGLTDESRPYPRDKSKKNRG